MTTSKKIQKRLRMYRTNQSFICAGIYNGFPKCCIKHFLLNDPFKKCKKCDQYQARYNTEGKIGKYCINCKEENMVDVRNYIEKNGTGFLPCFKCSQKIKYDKKLLPTLIDNRMCKTKFPFSRPRELSDKEIFLKEIIFMSKKIKI